MDRMDHSTTSVFGSQTEKARERLRKMVLSALLISLGVTGSLLPFSTFPIGASRCAPLQHLINVLGAVLLGPGYAVINAFLISLLRNMLGTGTLLAFPGSMIGALLAGVLYHWLQKDGLAVLGEFLGTGLIGGLAAYPFARWLMGNTPAAVSFFVVPFMISSGVGSAAAFFVLRILRRTKILRTRTFESRQGEQ